MAVEMVAMSGSLAAGAAGQEKLAGRLEVDSNGRIPGTLFLGGDGDQGSLIRRQKSQQRWMSKNIVVRELLDEAMVRRRKQKAKNCKKGVQLTMESSVCSVRG